MGVYVVYIMYTVCGCVCTCVGVYVHNTGVINAQIIHPYPFSHIYMYMYVHICIILHVLCNCERISNHFCTHFVCILYTNIQIIRSGFFHHSTPALEGACILVTREIFSATFFMFFQHALRFYKSAAYLSLRMQQFVIFYLHTPN